MRLKKDHSRFWLVCVSALLFVLGFTCSIRMLPLVFADDDTAPSPEAFFVAVFDDDEKTIVKASGGTVRELLARLGVTYSSEDIVSPSPDTSLTADTLAVSVAHTRPVLIEEGIARRYFTVSAKDPTSILLEAGFTLYDDDEIVSVKNPSLMETGFTEAYILKRGETYAAEKAARLAASTAAAEQTAAFVKAELAEATKPVIRPEWSGCAAWVRQAGVAEEDLAAALTIIYRESSCRPNARNSKSGAYGIPQALPGNKMASVGSDWETNPITQIRWMARYVTGRYGGWQQALDFWNSHHWY